MTTSNQSTHDPSNCVMSGTESFISLLCWQGHYNRKAAGQKSSYNRPKWCTALSCTPVRCEIVASDLRRELS